MSSDSSEAFLSSATQSIQNGHYDQALSLLSQAISLDPGNAEAHMLQGVALAQTGSSQAATEAFKTAARLAPTLAKAHYNLAKHLYDQNDRQGAIDAAREALRIDPASTSANELLAKLEGKNQAPPRVEMPFIQPPQMTPPPLAPHYMAPGEAGHSVAFVEKLGKKWVLIGWALVLVGLGLFIADFQESIEMIGAFWNNPSALANDPRFNTLDMTTVIMSLVGILRFGLSFAWVLVDILDRRGNMVWLVPYVLCCCVGMDWIVLAVLLLSEKRTS